MSRVRGGTSPAASPGAADGGGPRTSLFVAAALLLALAAALLRTPFLPALPSDGLDPGWLEVLLRGQQEGAVFGRDLVFMYGPLSLLQTLYFDAAAYPWVLLFHLATAAAGMAAVCLLLRREAAPWFLAFALAALLPLPLLWDSTLLPLPFLAALLRLAGGRAALGLALLLVLLTAIGGYSKFTFLVAGAMALPVADLLLLWRQRRPPVLTPLFLAAVLLTHLLSGQPLEGLPPFLSTSLEILRGYPAEAALPGPPGWGWEERAAFLAMAAALLALLLAGALGQARPLAPGRRLGALLLLALGLFALWKTGFVRHDGHAVTAWTALPPLAAAAVAPLLAGRLRRAALLLLLGTAFLLQLQSIRMHFWPPEQRPGPAGVAATILEGRAGALAFALRLLADPAGEVAALQAAATEARREIAQAYALPDLPGTVDVVGGPPLAALASGLDLDPRPTIYGHVAMTNALLQMNRAHLTGPGRPQWLLWRVQSIDGRYPSLDDGFLWPTILARYELTGATPHFLVMRARAAPLALSLEPLAERRLVPGKWVRIPRDAGAVWASVTLEESWADRLLALLWRPPLLTLEVQFVGGRRQLFPLPRALAAGGFLLSPLVQDLGGLQRLASGTTEDAPAMARPRRLRLLLEPFAAALLPEPQATLRLERLVLPSPADP